MKVSSLEGGENKKSTKFFFIYLLSLLYSVTRCFPGNAFNHFTGFLHNLLHVFRFRILQRLYIEDNILNIPFPNFHLLDYAPVWHIIMHTKSASSSYFQIARECQFPSFLKLL